MILIEKTETYGWEAAVRGMRNPKNSWGKSDSRWGCVPGHKYPECGEDCRADCDYIVGEDDLGLMKALASAGTDHGKFLRMITVTVDFTAPLYWWKEFDTYKVGTVANSCSTMHKLTAKEFSIDDFSHEHLYGMGWDVLGMIITSLNHARSLYLETDDPEYKKKLWWQMIQLLPTSYNQKRTVQLNYAVLKNIYHARKNHKLDCWHTVCAWIEKLPYSELITE